LKFFNKNKGIENINLFFSTENKSLNNLFFDLIFITDELTYYCLKNKAGIPYFDLAYLIYSVLFKDIFFKKFKNYLGKWV
jgi:hypothetical protein